MLEEKLDIIKNISKKTFYHFEQYKYEIFLDSYDIVTESEIPLIEKEIGILGQSEYHHHLELHHKVLLNFIYFNDSKLLLNYIFWRYRVYYHRNINLDFIQKENELSQNILYKYLIHPDLIDITRIYQFIITNHSKIVDIIHNEKTPSQKEDTLVTQLYQFAIVNDSSGFTELANQHIKDLESFCEFFTQFISKVVVKVGYEWEICNISVAKEHIALSVINQFVEHSFSKFEQFALKKEKVLLTTSPNEHHSLGISIAVKCLQKMGYEVINLGANTPKEDIKNAVLEFDPQYIIISATFNVNLLEVVTLIKELRVNDYEDKAQYFVAGYSLNHLSDPKKSLDCNDYFTSFEQFYNFFATK